MKYHYQVFKNDMPNVISLTSEGRYPPFETESAAIAMGKCIINQIYHPDHYHFKIKKCHII